VVNRWIPASPCGPGCVGPASATVGPVRAAMRLVRAACVLLAALLFLAPLSTVAGPRTRESLVRWVFGAMLRAFGARLEVRGELGLTTPHRGALVVVNHVSWLDILALNSIRPMRSVAKREIKDWPVVGPLAASAGTVFLDRGALRALPGTVAELAEALRGGALVSAYPEGTTWCGRVTGRFRPAVFQAAIDGGVPVRPVSLRYRLAGGEATSWPAFIGEDTLIDSVRRTARLRGLVVQLDILDEIAPGRAADRRELAGLAQVQVVESLTGSLGGESPVVTPAHPAALV
jgi:1-acyl-sn-glycerol-3-phosphate acyltransferase